MGCLVLKEHFLQFFEGKVSQIEYEFASEHTEQTSQRNVVYFIFDLNSLIEDDEQNDSKTNFIAGVIYDEQKDIAEKLKNYIQNCLTDNIYLKNKQYLEGFSNIIQGIYSFLDSIESLKSSFSQYQKYNGDKQIYLGVINLVMFIEDQVFMSKSGSKQDIYQNKWCIKLQNSMDINHNEIYNEVDDFKDVRRYDNYVYQLKESSKKIKEIILSSNQCSNDQITENVRTKYPKHTIKFNGRTMYFLKLKF
ncbi:hypothetical protein TTHERM_000011248 (macronuclear) [Tetrahymena thermophila SB210]|uniref:Uncharacterized protein n=1 Tax=Tetrahymena thermophila (strain SB210) TaxID=312017 RepID=W7XGY6_TETTS|nr:hypothetical protein TTHERM_000011248 [Tetrahymena thermophila SB210]EWS76328.1 hypothetical protein TTHERM_000011248 [Tetrahymena thermophila SB210]|eukprot:XP_012651112.1 hypothetical protein TTHERM_000011248 [Tetrahymena thermophila SB210]